MKALIVDDSMTTRKILSNMFEEKGCEVSTAANGEEALGVLQISAQEFDLVLIDWNMPVMDGLTLVKGIRGNPDWNSLPLMMVTSEAELPKMVDALEAGANEYMMKPFDKEMLFDKLSILGISTG